MDDSSRTSSRFSLTLSDFKVRNSNTLETEGKKLVDQESETDSATEIKNETNAPLSAKQKVEQYLLQSSDERFELHPEEGRASKIFKNKPGRILKPLGWTLQGGGGLALTVGVIGGIFTGLPGLILAGAGLGGAVLGDYLAKKGIQKQEKAREDILDRVGELGDSQATKIADDINSWFNGAGSKSLLKIKFETLEAEIKFSDKISYRDKVELLQKFTGKQVNNKRYQTLFKKFSQFKEVYSQSPEQLKWLFDEKSKLDFEQEVAKLKSQVLIGTFDIDDDQDVMTRKNDEGIKNGKDEFITGLLNLVIRGGKKEHKVYIEQIREAGIKDSQIWKSLTALTNIYEKKLKILEQKAENLLGMVDQTRCKKSEVEDQIAEWTKEFMRTKDEKKFVEHLVNFVKAKGKEEYRSLTNDKTKSSDEIWEMLTHEFHAQADEKKIRAQEQFFSSMSGLDELKED